MDIAIYDKFQDPLDAATRLGTFMAKSGMFGCENVEQGNMLAFICLVERKSPLFISGNYDIIKGKLRKKSLSLLADFKGRGGTYTWEKTGDDGVEAQGKFVYEGQSLTVKFTLDDAKRAGLLRGNESNWSKTPGNMLRARVISNAVGMLAPELLAGTTEADDVAVIDIDPAPELLPPVKAETSGYVTLTPPKFAVPVVEDNIPFPDPEQHPPQEKQSGKTPSELNLDMKKAHRLEANLTVEGKLDEATTAKLEAIFGVAKHEAYKWLVDKTWLRAGEEVNCISLQHAKTIISKPIQFMETVLANLQPGSPTK